MSKYKLFGLQFVSCNVVLGKIGHLAIFVPYKLFGCHGARAVKRH